MRFSNAFFCASVDKVLPAPMASSDYRKSVVQVGVLAKSCRGTELSAGAAACGAGLTHFHISQSTSLRDPQAVDRRFVLCQ